MLMINLLPTVIIFHIYPTLLRPLIRGKMRFHRLIIFHFVIGYVCQSSCFTQYLHFIRHAHILSIFLTICIIYRTLLVVCHHLYTICIFHETLVIFCHHLYTTCIFHETLVIFCHHMYTICIFHETLLIFCHYLYISYMYFSIDATPFLSSSVYYMYIHEKLLLFCHHLYTICILHKTLLLFCHHL